MTRFAIVILAAGLFALHSVAAESRIVLPLAADWKFFRGDETNAAAPNFDDSSWPRVTVPHSWNTESDPPAKDYYRGPGWYRKELKPEDAWKRKRVFIRFGAASLVAKVFLNGKELGEHKGGFAAFCFELTPHLQFGQTNIIAVRMDNSRREDVIPLTGDFTIYGGLYRDVSLLVTSPINITPLDHGSSGVLLRQMKGADTYAEVQVEAKIANGEPQVRTVTVRVEVHDTRGIVVASASKDAPIPSGETHSVTQGALIQNPRLWDGVADPYLYTARVTVSADGKPLDAVEQPLGLRSFSFDRARGFVLNGKAQQIRGVNRHQDWAGTGWAVSTNQENIDMQLIRGMGATGVRLAHYQHDDYFYSLCDRNGLVVWAELPLINDLRGTPEFLDNAREQLTELIRQNMNHPSIVLWSLYNEISPKNTNNPVPIIRNLNQLAKSEDASRPTVGALSGEGIEKLHQLGEVADVLALNTYPGWYFGEPDAMGEEIDKWYARYGSRGIIISEYGAGASVQQHQQTFEGRRGRAPANWHPEEWQALVHEANYAGIRSRPGVFGAFAWNMFDFASAAPKEGDELGLNDKGLVTRDRKIKKDAYFFYQANWAAKPMVYITSSRHVERAESNTVVKVYSNCPKVLLKVNGVDMGEMEIGDSHVFLSKVIALQIGENRIEVEGKRADMNVHDSCEWHYAPAPGGHAERQRP